MSDVARLLEHGVRGNRRIKAQHISRAEHLAQLIRDRFGVQHLHAWKAKHLRWALGYGLGNMSADRRYHYWLTARALVQAVGRWEDWRHWLQGPWTTPTPRVHNRVHSSHVDASIDS